MYFSYEEATGLIDLVCAAAVCLFFSLNMYKGLLLLLCIISDWFPSLVSSSQ